MFGTIGYTARYTRTISNVFPERVSCVPRSGIDTMRDGTYFCRLPEPIWLASDNRCLTTNILKARRHLSGKCR